MKYVARLKHRDANGRILRRIGTHSNLMAAWAFACERFGEKNVNSVKVR